MNTRLAHYLLVIGEREALAWILRESQMAFPGTTRREVDALAVGDRLFMTTTRACFHNPTRDATRVIGTAQVLSEVMLLDSPLELAGREFTRRCDLSIDLLAPYLEGVELAPLISKLDALSGSAAWGMRLRRPLVPLTAADAKLLELRLARIGLDPDLSQGTYLDRIHPVASSSSSARS